ncbi:hypothetical protein H5410_018173 [Solanum commersonii]|uniref:KIB1-4 beta-propeller domain-containing protein n=1 Tax=Solanum commersonii TaxID=4109 RepID=A0A9J6A1A0_SOLCO|nr:hypothetical protein H5410_018173 [Solanum commersonii]
MGDWSEINYDMLVLIAKRFNLIEDYLNFASLRKKAIQVDSWSVLTMKKKIPKASGKRCMKTMGWLVTVGNDEGEISLLHPFSGVQIELPHQKYTTENYHTHHQTGPIFTRQFCLLVLLRHQTTFSWLLREVSSSSVIGGQATCNGPAL